MGNNGENQHCFGNFGMYNPFLLDGMNAALERVVKAVNNGEKIVIYGYHDIDGVAAVSVLMLVLKYLNADVEYFISDVLEGDFSAGSASMKKNFRFLGASLIITVGCGANALSRMNSLKEYGIDVIVTDYHDFEGSPNESIIIDPKKKNCPYPFKDLTAAGLAYKLSQAIAAYYRMKCVSRYLDLVMLGTLSKKENLADENKVIAEEGMKRLKTTNNYGLKAMIKVNKLSEVNFEQVRKLIKDGHKCMVNSRGVDNARIMVELFTTSNSDRAEQIAKYLKKEVKAKQGNLI